MLEMHSGSFQVRIVACFCLPKYTNDNYVQKVNNRITKVVLPRTVGSFVQNKFSQDVLYWIVINSIQRITFTFRPLPQACSTILKRSWNIKCDEHASV